VLNSHL